MDSVFTERLFVFCSCSVWRSTFLQIKKPFSFRMAVDAGPDNHTFRWERIFSELRVIRSVIVLVMEGFALNQIKNGTIDSVFVKRFQENQKQFEKWVRKCQAMKMISEHFKAGEVSIFFHALIDGHFMWPMILNQKSNLNDHDYTSGKKIITQSFLAAFGMKRD